MIEIMLIVIALMLMISIVLQTIFLNVTDEIKNPIKPVRKKPSVYRRNPWGYQPTSNPPRTPPTRSAKPPPPPPPKKAPKKTSTK